MKKILVCVLVFLLGTSLHAQWSTNTAVNNQLQGGNKFDQNEFMIPDGQGGSFLVFTVYDPAGNNQIYAKRVNGDGSLAWGTVGAGVLVCDAANNRYPQSLIADGTGGMIVAWIDERNSPVNEYNSDVYIQKIDAAGVPQWTANGIAVTSSPAVDDFQAYLVADGSGGVIVGWNWDDYIANTKGFVQHYNAAGVPQWTAGGFPLISNVGFRIIASMVSDGAGGAIAFLIDTRNDAHGLSYEALNTYSLINADIFAQRVNASGDILWAASGMPVCTAANNQLFGSAVADGLGGAAYFFEDYRNDAIDINGDPSGSNIDIFAQRINAAGDRQWATVGVAVCTSGKNQSLFKAVKTSNGNFGVSWDTEGNGSETFAFGQLLNASGTALWTINGISLVGGSKYAYYHDIAADQSGNIICAFGYDIGNGALPILKAQKFNSSGAIQWTTGGVSVCTNTESAVSSPLIAMAESDAAIITWTDNRNVLNFTDIYGSKLGAGGTLIASSTGAFISAANGNWNNPATWVGGEVPGPTAEVKVRHTVTVTVNASCKKITIEQPAGVLYISSGIKLDVLQ